MKLGKPFSLLLILRLAAPVLRLKLVNDLGEIKANVSSRFKKTSPLWVIAWNLVQIFCDRCEDKNGFPPGLSFNSLWSFAISR